MVCIALFTPRKDLKASGVVSRPFRDCSLANAAVLFAYPPGASAPERIFPARARYDARCFEPEAGNKTATGTVSAGQKRVFFVTFFWQDKRKLVKEITDNYRRGHPDSPARSFSAFSAIVNSSITRCKSPSSTSCRLYRVSPIRWSVTRPCG